MRAVAPVLLLVLLALAGPALAQGDPAQPRATVQVTVEPEVATMEGPGVLQLAVRVQGRILCSLPVQPPEPVQVHVTVESQNVLERLQVQIDPSEFELEWTQASGTPGRFIVNETVEVRVEVSAAPTTRQQTNFSVLVEPKEAPQTRTRCSPEGYTIPEEGTRVPLIVSPADDEDALPLEGRVNWAPIVLAVVLLALVSAFAMRREKGRGGQ